MAKIIMEKYTASRLSSGNKLFPPSVETASEGMRIQFPTLFGGKETFVSYNDISSISYDAPMIGFTKLHINIRGNVTTVEGFYKGDCQAIITAWEKAKKAEKRAEKKPEWKQNRIREEEESKNITYSTTNNDQQMLSAKQQMKLEIKKLEIEAKEREKESAEESAKEIKKLKIEAKERAKEKAEERAEERKKERRERVAGIANNVQRWLSDEEAAKERKEKVAGIANNVQQWLSNDAEEEAKERAEKRTEKKKLDEVKSIELNPTDKDMLVKSLTALLVYVEMWANESDPEEYLILAKSNFDSGITLLQALDPSNPMISYFIQKQTILGKQAKKTKTIKLLLTITGIVAFLGLLILLMWLEKQKQQT